MDHRIYRPSAGCNCILRTYYSGWKFYPFQYYGNCRSGTSQVTWFIFKTRADLHHRVSAACLSACHDSGKPECQSDHFMLRILAWRLLLSNNGIINAILEAVGFGSIKMLNTQTAVVFGMVYDFLPFMILPIYNSMARIKQDIIDAAKDLGASDFVILIKIIIPLTLSGIISGIVMVFVPALTSFVISDLLGGGKVLLIGNVIEQEFMQGTNWNLGSGLSVVLMVFVIASMAFMNTFDKEGGGAAVW